jgi:hypothetical protein
MIRRRKVIASRHSGARGQGESMTFEPVVERLSSNVLCQRLISGKGLGQIRPKPRSRAPVALPALVAVSAAICAGV